MNPEQFQRIRELFEQALGQPAEKRAEWLRLACAGDASLLAAVQRLLDADRHADTTGLIEIPDDLLQAAAVAEAEPSNQLIGRRFGAFVLTRELGQGGMGQVFLAERADGEFKQEAALKLVRAGWDHAELLERFKRERQILASLNHPHIARLLDGGASDRGEPYLVLEYVQGAPIGEYCDRLRLNLEARLRLFLDVCSAVSYAHQRLVVHRDLKPSNILVTEDGKVKLLDFGIAKLLAADGNVTAPRDRLFTLGYAAPEQVRGDMPSVSVDVYALGLLLYELLTGQRAYGRTASTPAAYEREVLTAEPELPSQAANDTTALAGDRAACRGLAPAQLADHLSGDLDAIVMRALRKEPEARYASVADFADDVFAYLEHRPVRARRGNLRYRALRFAQRHALAVALSALALACLVLGLTVALWQAEQARQQRDLARAEELKSKAVAEFMVEVFGAADPALVDGASLTPKDLLAQGVRRLGEDNAIDPNTRSALLLAIGSAQLGVSDYESGLRQMLAAVEQAKAARDERAELSARLGLGVAFNKLSRSQDALREYQAARALARGIDELAPEIDENIDYYHAIELSQLDRKEEAVPMLRAVYDRRLARLGAGDPKTIEFATTLAYFYGALKQGEQALAITTPNYQAARARVGLPLRSLKDIVSAHGYLLLLGERAEAEALFREAIAIDERIYGENHPGTVVSINNLGFLYSSRGEPARGAEQVERAIAIRRAMNIEQHQELAFSLINAAIMWRKAGEWQRAIERAREGLAICQARADGFHRQAQKGRWNLALALEGAGEFAAALIEVDELLPYTDGRSKEFSGADSVLPWLLRARLLAQLDRAESGCVSARRVLAVKEALAESALEANILLVQCLRAGGATAEAEVARGHLTADAETLKRLSPYSRQLFESW